MHLFRFDVHVLECTRSKGIMFSDFFVEVSNVAENLALEECVQDSLKLL